MARLDELEKLMGKLMANAGVAERQDQLEPEEQIPKVHAISEGWLTWDARIQDKFFIDSRRLIWAAAIAFIFVGPLRFIGFTGGPASFVDYVVMLIPLLIVSYLSLVSLRLMSVRMRANWKKYGFWTAMKLNWDREIGRASCRERV